MCYGKLTPINRTSRLPVIYVFGRNHINLEDCVAKLVETAQDVLEELRWPVPPDDAPARTGGDGLGGSVVSGDGALLLEALGADPVSLDALLARSDIDAVIIALPITVQPSIVRKSLAAGKHVLSEKPVAPDVASGIELIREYETTYKPKGLVFRIAENYELEPGYHAAAKAIREGKIGKVNSENKALRERASKAEEKAAGVDDLTKQNGDLSAANLRLEVGYELGLPLSLAKRLQGSTKEEMVADAEALVELVSPAKRPPSDRPAEHLRGGGQPDQEPEERDLAKIGARMYRR